MNTRVIDYTNFKKEHICCVLRDRNGEGRIEAKRNWLENVFEDGLVIRKGDVNAKVFMEYIPADDAWCPVDAPGYMFIHCYRIDETFKIFRNIARYTYINPHTYYCVDFDSNEYVFNTQTLTMK